MCITALASATVILTPAELSAAEGGRELCRAEGPAELLAEGQERASEASERVNYISTKFVKNVASAVILNVHKMAKMAMLVIRNEGLKRLPETSPPGYCASHPSLALPENLESRRYREVWFPDTPFFVSFPYIGYI